MSLLSNQKSFWRRWKAIVVASSLLVIVMAVIVGGAIYFFLFSDYPGGVRPTYAARDGDARLTRDARTAMPVIAAIRHYRTQHNHFPSDISQLAPLLPAGTINLAGNNVDGWRYFSFSKSDAFELSLRLGWDPSLLYHGTCTSGTWAFEPGDGSLEKPIILNP